MSSKKKEKRKKNWNWTIIFAKCLHILNLFSFIAVEKLERNMPKWKYSVPCGVHRGRMKEIIKQISIIYKICEFNSNFMCNECNVGSIYVHVIFVCVFIRLTHFNCWPDKHVSLYLQWFISSITGNSVISSWKFIRGHRVHDFHQNITSRKVDETKKK